MKKSSPTASLVLTLSSISLLALATASHAANSDGWYLGLGAGYEGFQDNQRAFFDGSRIATFNTHANGWVGHLFGGYGWYFGSMYLGAEAFVGTSGASGSNNIVSSDYNGTFSVNNSYGASFIPGYHLTQSNVLLFGRVGVVQTQFTVKDALGTLNNNSTTWHTALNLGLGTEFPVYNNFALRFEYDYFDYSSFTNNGLVGSRNQVTDNRGIIDIKYNFVA